MRPRVRSLSSRRYLALAGIAALATAVFSFGLGSSSFFLDEIYTWYTVRGDLGDLRSHLVEQEVAPPLYYLLLHGWVLLTGADSETALRLPSVAAGVALVAAVYWLGALVGGRRAGLLSAGLAAVSPTVLLYAQQTRAYVWAMLAVTVAVAAAIEAVRGRSTSWLVAAGAAGAVAVLTHYTAMLVVAPVAVWVLLREDAFILRTRLLFAGALVAPLLALAPLVVEQMGRGHQAWTDAFGRLNVENVLRLIGTPFDGRFDGISALGRQAGAAVVIVAVAILAGGERLLGIRDRRLVAAAAVVPIVAVIFTSAVVHPVALGRYTAVAAPFALVAIGVVAVHVQRVLGGLLVGVTLVLSVVGVLAASRSEGRYPDTRGTIETVAERWRDGDVIVGVNLFAYPDALAFYAGRMIPAPGREIHNHATFAAAFDAPDIVRATRRRARIWLAADPPVARSELGYAFARRGYRLRRQWLFPGVDAIQLVLASPDARR
jgi:mannosyltransferase